MTVFILFGSIVGWMFIICSLLLDYTKRGQYIVNQIKHKFLIWKYESLYPWFNQHKNSWFFKSLENANWFHWYGKRVVYVKSKDPSKLTSTQADVKKAIQEKNYKKALDILNSLPETSQTISIKQVIESKLT